MAALTFDSYLAALLLGETAFFVVGYCLVVRESKQGRLDDIGLQGIRAAAERVMDLAVMERYLYGTSEA